MKRITFHPVYAVVTLAAVAGIYWLSSLSELGTMDRSPIVQTVSNLVHIPLYAGLAFCCYRALTGRDSLTWWPYAVTLLGTGAYAVFDEWHQSFVPEREASVGDLVRDLIGISAMLLFLYLRAVRIERASQASPVRDL